MLQPDQVRQFVKEYDEYARTVLRPNRDELKKLFKSWKDPNHWARHAGMSRQPAPSPVQRALSRIKRPESVVDKVLRKPTSFPDGLTSKSLGPMYDALGGRVVVYFLENLPLVDQELRESEVLEVSSIDPPTAYLTHELAEMLGLTKIHVSRKDSGYASLHYTVRFRPTVLPSIQRPWFELQVRTLVEDVWGEIEHVLGYKPNKRTSFAVRRQFRIIASELTAIDEHFNLLYQELSRFQREGIFRDSDPLNAENLPPVLSDLGIGCAQSEIDGQLKLLASRGIQTVGELRENATAHRLEVIRKGYRDYRNRQPTDFETVAGVAAARGLDDDEAAILDAIRGQIDILEAWMGLKQQIRREDAT
jgi:putative GTP pyrophosphokinase